MIRNFTVCVILVSQNLSHIQLFKYTVQFKNEPLILTHYMTLNSLYISAGPDMMCLTKMCILKGIQPKFKISQLLQISHFIN